MLLVAPHPLSAFPSWILSPSKLKALHLSQSCCWMSAKGRRCPPSFPCGIQQLQCSFGVFRIPTLHIGVPAFQNTRPGQFFIWWNIRLSITAQSLALRLWKDRDFRPIKSMLLQLLEVQDKSVLRFGILGGKKVNVVSWPSLVKEPTEIYASSPWTSWINNTTPTGGSQCKPHLWGCSVALQMTAKLLFALAASGSCPKSRGDMGSKLDIWIRASRSKQHL